MSLPGIDVNIENRWRLETPGAQGWQGSARAGAVNKYFMLSSDSHADRKSVV